VSGSFYSAGELFEQQLGCGPRDCLGRLTLGAGPAPAAQQPGTRQHEQDTARDGLTLQDQEEKRVSQRVRKRALKYQQELTVTKQ
jgi:hypothetical protein